MKLAWPESDAGRKKASRQALARLVVQPSVRDLRPCPDCDLPCPAHASPECCCGCSAACPDVSRQMSVEPDAYPIEPGIAPLVFEFYALRLCPPCCSCEGHADAAGKLTRLPRVWFFCREISYLGLIADRLFQLRHARVLHQPWQVRTELDNESGGDAAFSLEPALRPGDAPTLGGLRHDALVLADGFADAVRAAARAQTKAP